MGRVIKEVLQFCIDVVQRRPHKLDRLMNLLNLDSQELLTNQNLQEVTSLLKDHYDLLVRFSQIFMPPNYKLAPWKDMATDRVYCMLIKGGAMYKLTALDGELQQYDAISAAKRHEDQERKAKRASHLIPRVSIDSDSLTEECENLQGGGGNMGADGLPIPLKQYNKLIENAITIQNTASYFHSVDETPATKMMTTQAQPTRKRPSAVLLEQPRGSRTRPSGRRFSLAIPFLKDLSSPELVEFLHHKGMTDESSFDKESAVKLIIKDCKLSDSTPFEVLPTFLKNFKNRGGSAA